MKRATNRFSTGHDDQRPALTALSRASKGHGRGRRDSHPTNGSAGGERLRRGEFRGRRKRGGDGGHGKRRHDFGSTRRPYASACAAPTSRARGFLSFAPTPATRARSLCSVFDSPPNPHTGSTRGLPLESTLPIFALMSTCVVFFMCGAHTHTLDGTKPIQNPNQDQQIIIHTFAPPSRSVGRRDDRDGRARRWMIDRSLARSTDRSIDRRSRPRAVATHPDAPTHRSVRA